VRLKTTDPESNTRRPLFARSQGAAIGQEEHRRQVQTRLIALAQQLSDNLAELDKNKQAIGSLHSISTLSDQRVNVPTLAFFVDQLKSNSTEILEAKEKRSANLKQLFINKKAIYANELELFRVSNKPALDKESKVVGSQFELTNAGVQTISQAEQKDLSTQIDIPDQLTFLQKRRFFETKELVDQTLFRPKHELTVHHLQTIFEMRVDPHIADPHLLEIEKNYSFDDNGFKYIKRSPMADDSDEEVSISGDYEDYFPLNTEPGIRVQANPLNGKNQGMNTVQFIPKLKSDDHVFLWPQAKIDSMGKQIEKKNRSIFEVITCFQYKLDNRRPILELVPCFNFQTKADRPLFQVAAYHAFSFQPTRPAFEIFSSQNYQFKVNRSAFEVVSVHNYKFKVDRLAFDVVASNNFRFKVNRPAFEMVSCNTFFFKVNRPAFEVFSSNNFLFKVDRPALQVVSSNNFKFKVDRLAFEVFSSNNFFFKVDRPALELASCLDFSVKISRQDRLRRALNSVNRSISKVSGSRLRNGWEALSRRGAVEGARRFLRALFEWRLQKVQKQEEAMKLEAQSAQVELSTSVSELRKKKLAGLLSIFQRPLREGMSAIKFMSYSVKMQRFMKLLPVMVRGNIAQQKNLKDVLLYWYHIKDDNLWFAKINRAIIAKTSLNSQIALWRLKLFRKTQDGEVKPGLIKALLNLIEWTERKETDEVGRALTKMLMLIEHETYSAQFDGNFSETIRSEVAEEVEEVFVPSVEPSLRNMEVQTQGLHVLSDILQGLTKKRLMRSFHQVRRRAIQQLSASGLLGDHDLNKLSFVETGPQPNPIHESLRLVFEENRKCRSELELKESKIRQLQTSLESHREDMMLMKNRFFFLFIDKIDRIFRLNAMIIESQSKRRFFRNLIRY
jgi:hypothetical protein